MNKEFSIYDSPFSEETKKIRRNSLVLSGLSLFIGLSGNLPKELSLFGLTFTPLQQNIIGWFILAVALYHYLHFLSVALVELAKWIHPFYAELLTKKRLVKHHPAFDETDFMDIPDPNSEYDKGTIYENTKKEYIWQTQNKLKYLYNWVYLKLVIEIIVPIIIGTWGLIELFNLITNYST